MTIRPFVLLLAINVLPACGGMVSDKPTAEGLASDSITEESFPAVPVTFTLADSARIVDLLNRASERSPEMSRMEYFGRQFIGIPYVAHTLDKNTEHEQLTVDLSGLDCTTFMETCAALSVTDQRGERTFEAFCRVLSRLRYSDGRCDGYSSRLHYFLTWVENNIEMGFLDDLSHEGYPFTATKTLDLHYMSRNPKYYKQLVAHPEWIPQIAEQEQRLNGKIIHYIPKSLLNESPSKLSDIRSGDIVGIITSKDGLDTTHVGIAVWQNGKLHLLNASSVYHKVVLDEVTFYDYMSEHKLSVGITIVRLKGQ